MARDSLLMFMMYFGNYRNIEGNQTAESERLEIVVK